MSKEQKKAESKGKRPKYIKIYLGLLISIICIWWVLRYVESQEVLERILGADVLLLMLAVFTTFISYLLRSWRWPFFFAANSPNFKDSYRCLIIGFFMNNVLPARMGELVRAHLGGKATSQSRSIVLATIAGERLADGLMISVLFAVLFTLGSNAEEIARGKEIYYVSYFFLFACIATVLLLLKRKRIFSLLEKLGGIMPGHLSTYTLVRIKRFIHGLEPLLKPSRLVVLGVFSLVVWLTELLVYYQVSQAFHQPMTLGALSLFLAAVNFSSLVPAAPGAIGVIEAFATIALVRIGIDPETALAMIVTQHLIQYVVVGVPGSFFFFMRMGGKIPETETESYLDEDSLYVEEKFADVSEPRPLIGRDSAAASDQELASADTEEAKSEGIDISVIIPAYNEEIRLPKTLLLVLEYISTRDERFEIIVVDDGSSDETSKVVRQFEALSSNVRLLVYPENRGKGYAVRFGIMNAKGSLVLYSDADGSTPIEELERLCEAIASGAHIAVGSRARYSQETHVETVWYRKFIGRVFSGFVNMLILPGIADTQCGFKMFTRPVARYLFSKQETERFSFDVEVLFLARKAGLTIAEVPINWTNVPGSKVNIASDSVAMFFDILKFRLKDMMGRYGHHSV